MMVRRLHFAAVTLAALTAVVSSSAVACRDDSQSSAPSSATTSGSSSDAIGIEATTPKGRLIFDAARLRHPLLTAPEVDHITSDARGLVVSVDAPRFKDRQATVHLPTRAGGPLIVEASGVQATVVPRGFGDVSVEWAEHLAVYPDVMPGVHAFRRPAFDGVEDFYQVTTPRDSLSFSFDVALENVAGLRLVANTLELLDAGGAPRLRSDTPVAIDANGVRRSGEIVVSGCAYDTDARGPWGRPVTPPGASSCTVTMRIDGRGLTYPVLVDPAWVATFNTKNTHAYHKMFVLTAGVDAGRVLIAGGTGSAPNSTELFDAATNSWAIAALLPDANGLGQGMNGAMLSDGRVVLAGGFPAAGTLTAARATTFIRKTDGTWTIGAALSTGRAWHTMDFVRVGGKDQILATGGQSQTTLSTTVLPSKTSELYDPVSDNWLPVGSMSITRTHGGSAVMSDGRVIVVGGETQSTSCCSYLTPTAVTDIWDPATSTWTVGPTLGTARAYPTVVALPASSTLQLVVAGGFNATAFSLNSLETLNRTATTFAALTPKLSTGREWATGTLLADNRVLFVGGNNSATSFTQTPTDTTDLYDPVAGTVVASALVSTPRMNHAAVSLGAKGVLVTGGLTASTVGSETSLSELYDTSIGASCTTTCSGGLTCTDGVCCTRASCPTGQTCNAAGHEGVCTKPKGATCTLNSECATGFCVGSFCCESSCSAGCKSCGNPGSEGTCVLALVGTDPGGFCSPGSSDPACGMKCDGTGKCGGYAPTGTLCGASLTDGGTPFCTTNTCSGFGFCSSTPNNCGLTCTTSVTCNESTMSCTASSAGVKAGFCVIDSTCYTYGDINPKDGCQFCNPPVSKIAWSTTDACRDGGVDDTGVEDDVGLLDSGKADSGRADSGKADTGKGDADSGVVDSAIEDTATDDTGTAIDDSGAPDSTLPSSSACSCETPGSTRSSAKGNTKTSVPIASSLALLGLAVSLLRRRRTSHAA